MSRPLSASQLATLRNIDRETYGMDAWVVNREPGATVPGLVRGGYIESKTEKPREGVGGRLLTWVKLTDKGRAAIAKAGPK